MEEENNEDCSNMDNGSGSETDDAQSQTSEDDSEIDLLEIDTNEDFSRETSFSSKSGMNWSSTPPHPSKTKFSSTITEKSGLTEFTKTKKFY